MAARIFEIAVMELQQQNPDIIVDINSLQAKMSHLITGEWAAEASRIYDDDEGYRRHIVNKIKDYLVREDEPFQTHFPLHLYGIFAKRIAEAVAQGYDASVDIVLGAMFSAIGAAVGNKFKVAYKNYTNHLSLWYCALFNQGRSKTDPLSWIMQPLDDIDRALFEKNKVTIREWKQSGQQGERPKQPRLFLTDSTPEARDLRLADNPRGLTIFRDELEGLFKDIGRYNNSGEIENLLSIWSCKGYRVDRATKDPLLINNPLMGIIGGTQPDTLKRRFKSAGLIENGFFSRWCFVYPETPVLNRPIQIIPQDIVEDWKDYIRGLYDDDTQPRVFELDDDAMHLHEKFYIRIADDIADPNVTEEQKGVLAKLRIIVFRLAGIIHLLKDGPTADILINGDTMEAAILSVEALRAWSFKALKLIQGGTAGRGMTQGELVRAVRTQWPEMNVSKFCDSVGMSRDTFNYYFRK